MKICIRNNVIKLQPINELGIDLDGSLELKTGRGGERSLAGGFQALSCWFPVGNMNRYSARVLVILL